VNVGKLQDGQLSSQHTKALISQKTEPIWPLMCCRSEQLHDLRELRP